MFCIKSDVINLGSIEMYGFVTVWTSMDDEPCHTPIPGPTRLADPSRFQGARTYTGTLYLIFFFKAELVPMGMAHIL